MKKIFYTLLLLVSGMFLFSCSFNSKEADIITTLFPQYDIAKNIAGDKLTVSMLTPFGNDGHDFEPSAREIVAINEAKLFIYTSNNFDGWIGKLKDNDNALNIYVQVTQDVDEIDSNRHFWTDPITFIEMINAITEEIIEIDSNNEQYYLTNKNNYIAEIMEIYNDTNELINNSSNKTIYYAGHDAMNDFGERFNLNIVPLIDDLKPEADYTSGDFINFIKDFKASGSKYLFIEELAEPKAANTIKNELLKDNIEITLLELHGYHNITKQQDKEGVTYGTLFKQNYENLKQALA